MRFEKDIENFKKWEGSDRLHEFFVFNPKVARQWFTLSGTEKRNWIQRTDQTPQQHSRRHFPTQIPLSVTRTSVKRCWIPLEPSRMCLKPRLLEHSFYYSNWKSYLWTQPQP